MPGRSSAGRVGPAPFSVARRRFLQGIAAAWVLAIAATYAAPPGAGFIAGQSGGLVPPSAPVDSNTVVVTHWAAGHLMPDNLLPKFAQQFNSAGSRSSSGKRIEVRLAKLDSFEQVDKLDLAVRQGRVAEPTFGAPVIVTPVVDHWLAELNARAGREVVDLRRTDGLATAWTGIAMYREMAECLGWPQREIGYAEVMALNADPHGWATCPTAKSGWGQQPLMSYTDPGTSSTARSVLFGLYSAAAGKPTDRLTAQDVNDPRVVEYVKRFQAGVDHYVPNTLVLLTKMTLGYSHIYWVAEDILVQLKQGKAPVVAPSGTQLHPLAGRDMVFIYPKEGSVAHNNPAGVVQAPWVDAERADAARQWIEFLRQPAQQEAFMEEGFRPAIDLPIRCPICPGFGLDPNPPRTVLKPIDPSVGTAIVGSWEDIKKPGIVTFVLDSSGSMSGKKLEQAKQGIIDALDGLSKNTQVGFLDFGDGTKTRIPVMPIQAGRFQVADAVRRISASGGTALYDAIEEAIRLSDGAEGDAEAIRGVVVLTDGQANQGQSSLDSIVTMSSRDEVSIRSFGGRERVGAGIAEDGRSVPKAEIQGVALKIPTRHPVHIFFVGVGDADTDIGRILAEATNAAYQRTTEGSLSEVLATFGKYF